jgi:hypothetical protein
MTGPGLVVPDAVLVESYGRLRSVHKVGAEVGLNFANVAVRLNRLGVGLPKSARTGRPSRLDGQPIRQPEKHFTQEVVDLARMFGWQLVYHTYWSEHSAAGFPDLVLCKPPRLVFAELKVGTIVKPAQQAWLDGLADVAGVETYIWRPADMQGIVDVLRGERP